MTPQIRPALETDIAAIAAIYRDYVVNGVESFELAPPDETEMTARFNKVRAAGCPYIVAQSDGGDVLGYAYASLFHTRPAYRLTVENSIYLAPAARGRGIGGLLLEALIRRCEDAGFRQMIAVITRLERSPSIRLHEKFGFRHAGILENTGFKHNRWLDVVYMQRALGAGNGTPPPPAGI